MTSRLLLAATLALTFMAATAQTVTFNGAMGDKALLVIDGEARPIPVGATVQGVKLVTMSADEARVEFGGHVEVLRLGSPAHLSRTALPSSANREIVLTAGMGGHFVTGGAINGRPVQFMVDTGATAIALSQADADRIGLDYRNGQRVGIHTANGIIPGHVVNLTSVRVGDVEVFNVSAVVQPTFMEYVLLGNSFLTRFQMKRENDTLTLQKR
ncbi:MAG TPA: retropepsin-like aspartic protease [Burkholderiaceae bacterium]|nr:retropepsin-like aspartic protease [Burkholderiaceae bacterium]